MLMVIPKTRTANAQLDVIKAYNSLGLMSS